MSSFLLDWSCFVLLWFIVPVVPFWFIERNSILLFSRFSQFRLFVGLSVSSKECTVSWWLCYTKTDCRSEKGVAPCGSDFFSFFFNLCWSHYSCSSLINRGGEIIKKTLLPLITMHFNRVSDFWSSQIWKFCAPCILIHAIVCRSWNSWVDRRRCSPRVSFLVY